MTLTYFDPIENRNRIKRRYVWAFWGFWGGLATGCLATLLPRLI